jgi:hypothetical protein
MIKIILTSVAPLLLLSLISFGASDAKAGVYTSGQIDDRWTDPIEKDFSQWLEAHMDELPVPKEQIQELLKEKTW